MTDKQAYEAALSEYGRVKAFIDKPRCVNCDNFSKGECGHYGPVPEEHQYKPTDCERWMYQIPF